jgi:uncharacterized Zn finger protein
MDKEEKDISIECPHCGHNLSTVITMVGPKGTAKLGKCQKCGGLTLNEFEQNHNYAEPSDFNSVKCPFCQSTDCKKISGASKFGKVALFGVFAAGSVSKTWHCNNCGSNFG